MSWYNFYMTIDQDAADGAALRRLREALPEGTYASVVMGDPGYRQPYGILLEMRGRYTASWYGADTIAEAADACREALER